VNKCACTESFPDPLSEVGAVALIELIDQEYLDLDE
jgi:hypothetical protein